MGRYNNSESWLKRAEKSIPLGSQTFSKSKTQYPVGISPLYIERGKGAYVWDVDNNKYVDLVNALGAVTLGYSDKRMNSDLRKQMKKGISFSLPGKLEALVAEKLVQMIPSAEMVRFAKNGSDATSAAIRLARAYTNREIVLVCGYHGWQDWFIGTTSMNRGVPESISRLSLPFKYNDISELTHLFQIYSQKIAAVIMEPMNTEFPRPNYLQEVYELVHKNGSILIFDETVTGFRLSKGGAQELFGVVPDLSTFGKGMANGLPLSALVGRKEIMQEMESIFFSSTFGGELLSLAAAYHVLNRYEKDNIAEYLFSIGEELANKTSELILEYELENIINLTGHPSWKFIRWNSFFEIESRYIKSYFLQEMYRRGILLINSHNVSYSMKKSHIDKIIISYRAVLSELKCNLTKGKLMSKLEKPPLEPLFKIR